MTVGQLRKQLESFDDDMEVVIGMRQDYGSDFAMTIIGCVDEYNVTAYGDEDCRAVVITEGEQIGIVDYSEDE